MFDEITEGTRWHAGRRPMYDRMVDVPRLTASLPRDGPVPPVLDSVTELLTERYGESCDQRSVAWYRDGRDSVAPHGDQVAPRDRHLDHGHRLVRRAPALPALPGRRRHVRAPRPRPGRPAGHGRHHPAHLAPRGPEDHPARGSPALPHVPSPLVPAGCDTGLMRSVAVHHVSVNVRDADEAIRFYTETLGLRRRDDRPDFGFGGAWLDLGGQQVHLIETGDGGVPDDRGQHFAVEVDDLDAAVAELREAGIEIGDPTPVGTGRQAFLHDPSGNRIELHQPG